MLSESQAKTLIQITGGSTEPKRIKTLYELLPDKAEAIGKASEIFKVLLFDGIEGNALQYHREKSVGEGKAEFTTAFASLLNKVTGSPEEMGKQFSQKMEAYLENTTTVSRDLKGAPVSDEDRDWLNDLEDGPADIVTTTDSGAVVAFNLDNGSRTKGLSAIVTNKPVGGIDDEGWAFDFALFNEHHSRKLVNVGV